MNFNQLTAEALDVLQPDAVQAWLKARGWEDDGPEGPAARGFSKRGGRAGAAVLAPTRPTSPDFRKFMGILIERVADAESMTPEAVLNDLGAAGYDVLRVRVIAAEDGAIDLDRALTVVQQSRAALQAAARAAASRTVRRSYVGRQAETVTQLLEQVRVGQTERGSYVLPILVPYAFDPADAPSMVDWFGRRAMRKLATGLNGLDRALGKTGADDVAAAFSTEAQAGVSADLCQSLGKLLSDVGDVEMSVRWAVAQPDAQEAPSVRFAAASAQTLLRVAHLLKEQDPPPPEPIIGFVTKLDDKLSGSNSTMVVDGLIEGKWRNIELTLEDRYRTVAADAFRDRRPVVLEGPLMRQGKRLVMTSVLQFGLHEQDDGDAV